MARAMTLKFVKYEFVPSDARTGFCPIVDEGTMNEPENEPKLSVCKSNGEVATLTALKLTITVAVAAKPCPVIETEVPYGPFVGLRIVFGVTVNVAAAILLVESAAVTM